MLCEISEGSIYRTASVTKDYSCIRFPALLATRILLIHYEDCSGDITARNALFQAHRMQQQHLIKSALKLGEIGHLKRMVKTSWPLKDVYYRAWYGRTEPRTVLRSFNLKQVHIILMRRS